MKDTSPSIKITYFDDGKGRNELSRLILAVGNVPYEDDLIGFKEYGNLRSAGMLPFGQLPILTLKCKVESHHGVETSEKVFGQSCSMARYVAKRASLYPVKDDIEALRTDAIVDSWRDMLDLFYETVFARIVIDGKLRMFPRPSAERYSKLQSFVSTELKENFARYEKWLSGANEGNKDGDVVGGICDKEIVPFPCWADLAIYDLVKTMECALTADTYQKVMSDKAFLKALVSRIDDMESIQNHLKKRPYKDINFLFAKVPIWKRILESVLMPVARIAFVVFEKIKSLTGVRKIDKDS